ncbi:MAG: ABC transporter ATP-binding protein [Mariniblastus sp.]|nr:ABC transporter ATP-binding protein [Mariniblastus sp.]
MNQKTELPITARRLMIPIHLEQLEFRYPRSDFLLKIDQLAIEAGSRVAIVGPSGSGKTTLLNLMAGICSPQQGRIQIGSHAVSTMSDAERRNFRISRIGMVFQQFELVDYLNTEENILLPFAINQSIRLSPEDRQYAESLAVQMGLGDKIRRLPHRLSQGEQQRVAICRALVTRPSLIFADEPTGNLDPKNKTRILDILFGVNREEGQTLIVVTHDTQILDGFERIIDFQDFTVDANPASQPDRPRESQS